MTKPTMNSIILFSLLLVSAFAQQCSVYLPNEEDMIVMDMEQRGPGGGWEYQTELPGWKGSGYLTYKPYSNIGWAEAKPDNMADERIKTFFFKVNTPGTYRVSIRSAAPHGTEHNDIWMSLPESGALMRRHGVTTDLSYPLDPNTDWNAWVDHSNWFKVYQNSGGDNWHWGGKTVDHHGHDIITRPLRADGTWYSVRICGRSTQFKVDRISLFLCEDDTCGNHSARFFKATHDWGMEQSQCEVPVPRVVEPVSPPAVTPTPEPVDAHQVSLEVVQ